MTGVCLRQLHVRSAPAARRRSIIAALPFSAASQRGSRRARWPRRRRPRREKQPAMCKSSRNAAQCRAVRRPAGAGRRRALLQQALTPSASAALARDQRELVGAGAGRGDGRGETKNAPKRERRFAASIGSRGCSRSSRLLLDLPIRRATDTRRVNRAAQLPIMLPQVRPVWNPGGPAPLADTRCRLPDRGSSPAGSARRRGARERRPGIPPPRRVRRGAVRARPRRRGVVRGG